jgi:hypothetical protein
MNERYFDDLKPGEQFQSGAYNVTEDEIINFARAFDPPRSPAKYLRRFVPGIRTTPLPCAKTQTSASCDASNH